MCKQNKEGNREKNDVYTKNKNPNKKNKTKRKHQFRQRKQKKNRNTKITTRRIVYNNRIYKESQHTNSTGASQKKLSVQVLKVNVSVKNLIPGETEFKISN